MGGFVHLCRVQSILAVFKSLSCKNQRMNSTPETQEINNKKQNDNQITQNHYPFSEESWLNKNTKRKEKGKFKAAAMWGLRSPPASYVDFASFPLTQMFFGERTVKIWDDIKEIWEKMIYTKRVWTDNDTKFCCGVKQKEEGYCVKRKQFWFFLFFWWIVKKNIYNSFNKRLRYRHVRLNHDHADFPFNFWTITILRVPLKKSRIVL